MNRKAERLLSSIRHLGKGETMVEIGCVRSGHEVPSEGFSTYHLAAAAADQGFRLLSVDSSAEAVEIARSVTGKLPVEITEGDGETWLAAFDGKIDALYLDGAGDPEEALRQFTAAPLSNDATIVIDDVQMFDGNAEGKGSLLLAELRERGYEVSIHETEPGYLMAVARQRAGSR